MLRSETADDPDKMAKALAGLRAYQQAARAAPGEPMPSIGGCFGAALRDYGGDGPPVIFVPSLINPPNVLDLGGDRSLLCWLAWRGHRVLLLDWGWDIEARRTLDVAGHVEQILLPLLAQLEVPPALVGYCLGGTMAIAAACSAPVRSLATIAAPWRFSGFDEAARGKLAALWADSKASAEALGALPMEVLQSAFWGLDPARTVGKFVSFADMAPDSAEARIFVTLEDWANDGPPIPLAAAREIFENLFGDDLPGNGRWQVEGDPVDPAALPCPWVNIVSTTDRIVPFATAAPAGERLELAQGHVGMVVGSRRKEALWQPLADWLSSH